MRQLPKVVVTHKIFEETRSRLAEHARLDINDAIEPWPRAVLREHCADAEGVLAFMTDWLDSEFFSSCPNLKVVGAALKGYDNIDIAAATRHGVRVAVVPDLLTAPTAELTIGLMIALGRNVLAGDRLIRTGGFSGWRPTLYGMGLEGATVTIMGFGKVGRAIARRLTTFGCRLLAFDAGVQVCDAEVTAVSFDEGLALGDYVVLALPLTMATTHIIGEAALSCMKPGALLINPARGSLVDEAAVARALEAGRLGGYAADVFACEDWARGDRPKGIDRRLTAPEATTVLTTHIGSAVANVRRKIELFAANAVIEGLLGRVPEGTINEAMLKELPPGEVAR